MSDSILYPLLVTIQKWTESEFFVQFIALPVVAGIVLLVKKVISYNRGVS